MTQDATGPSASAGASSGAEPRAEPTRRHSHTHLPGQGHSADTEEGLRAIAIATGAMFVVAAVEFLFFTFSNSAGLLSDALHNLGDVLTTVALWTAFQIARRPATRHYTYGFHRAEDLSGAFIVLVIVASAVAAAWQSYDHLIHNVQPTQLGWGIAAALVGFAGNEAIAEYKIRVGKRINSQPLIADGQHSRTDGLTSLAAATGLFLTALGVPKADPVAGLLISVAILYILVDVGREVLGRLMDAVDPAIVARIRAQAEAVPGVERVEDIRARWAGRRLYTSLNLWVDSAMPLAEAHAIAERARQEILTHLPGAAQVDIHVDPASDDDTHDPHAWRHEPHDATHEHDAHDTHHDAHDTHEYQHDADGHTHA